MALKFLECGELKNALEVATPIELLKIYIEIEDFNSANLLTVDIS